MPEMCHLLHNSPQDDFKYILFYVYPMISYIKKFEVIFSTNNLSGMHISTMWHSLNVLKYFCPLSAYTYCLYVTSAFLASSLRDRTHLDNNREGVVV